jgi:hypothetical protein
MNYGYLSSIGLQCASCHVASLSSVLQSIASAPLLGSNPATGEPHHIRERFFILKSPDRSSVVTSQEQQLWALRSHTNCGAGEQPHQRMATAQREASVVALFAEKSENAWVGYALMDGDPWIEEGAEFPNVMKLRWRVALPHAKGVMFSHVAFADDAHKVFTGDEIAEGAGRAIRKAIDDKITEIRLQEEAAHSALLESSFLQLIPDESEPRALRRLLEEVELRLGKVIFACMCGSRRYNLNFPDSDFDMLVIYAARDLNNSPMIFKNPSGLHPDYTVVEAGRFAQMLVEGDPRMVESLFLHQCTSADSQQLLNATDDVCRFCWTDPWLSLASSAFAGTWLSEHLQMPCKLARAKRCWCSANAAARSTNFSCRCAERKMAAYRTCCREPNN